MKIITLHKYLAWCASHHSEPTFPGLIQFNLLQEASSAK